MFMITAFPFAFSQNDAIIQLGPMASIACFFKSFLRSVGARVLGLDFKPIQPDKIQAVYLPTWFIDAELEANAWVTPADGSEPALVRFPIVPLIIHSNNSFVLASDQCCFCPLVRNLTCSFKKFC
jgi:hypothetical protein